MLRVGFEDFVLRRIAVLRLHQLAEIAWNPDAPLHRVTSAFFEDVHEPGAAEPAVVLQGDASALNLAAAGFSAQLPGQFRNLRQSRCPERMALGQQTAGRIDDDITAIGIGSPGSRSR